MTAVAGMVCTQLHWRCARYPLTGFNSDMRPRLQWKGAAETPKVSFPYTHATPRSYTTALAGLRRIWGTGLLARPRPLNGDPQHAQQEPRGAFSLL